MLMNIACFVFIFNERYSIRNFSLDRKNMFIQYHNFDSFFFRCSIATGCIDNRRIDAFILN